MIGGRHRIRVICPGCQVTQRFWPYEVTFWVDPTDGTRTEMRWVCPDDLCVCAGRDNVTVLDAANRADLAVMVGDGSVTLRVLDPLPAHPEGVDRGAPKLTAADIETAEDELAGLDRPGWASRLTGDRG